MSLPRFRLVRGCTQGGLSVPAWPTAQDPFAVSGLQDVCWFSWRLLGANNRELGRGADVHAGEAACVSAIAGVQARVTASKSVPIVVDGRWTWTLVQAGAPVAVAGRTYQRQRECRYSVEQFLLGLVGAVLPLAGDPSLRERDVSHCLAPRSRTCGRLAPDGDGLKGSGPGRAGRGPVLQVPCRAAS